MTILEEPIAHHLGYAVYDADVVADRYSAMLGAEWTARTVYDIPDIYNRPAKIRVCYGAVRGMTMEIIAPMEGESIYTQFLRRHGEGIQHVGFWVPDVRKATDELVQKGARVDWIYTLERDDAKGYNAAAQLTADSSVSDVLGAVSDNGILYMDIKEGGTAIEFLEPYIHSILFDNNLREVESFSNERAPRANGS